MKLRIPELWKFLGLPGTPAPSCRCPWRDDRKASLSIFQGGQAWYDHGTCEGGDAIDFIGKAIGVSNSEATRKFLELAGAAKDTLGPALSKRVNGLKIPSDLRPGTAQELQSLAHLRRVSFAAICRADALGILHFGTVCGEPTWIVTDDRRLCAEARTMSGSPFPAFGNLPVRKAHTLGGSTKSWPVGVAPVGTAMADFQKVLLVEGGPDLLAAFHFLVQREEYKALPITFLGRGAGRAGIHPESLLLLTGKRVRIYPHCDPDGGGHRSAERWADQLMKVGAVVDAYSFAGLRRRDGKAVSDLNDAVLIAPEQRSELEGLLP